MNLKSHNWKYGVAAFAVAALGGGSFLFAQGGKGADLAKTNDQPPAVEKDSAKADAKQIEKRKAKVRVVPPGEATVAPPAFLGVATRPLEPENASDLKLAKGSGLVVEYVANGSPAAKAGVEVDDILYKVDDQILFNSAQLKGLIGSHKAGDEIGLSVLRDGKVEQMSAELSAREEGVKRAPWVLPNPDPFLQQPAKRGNRLLPRGGGLQFHLHGQPGGVANGKSTAVIVDGSGKYEITNNNGEKHLKASSPDGKILFDGPITTEEQKKKVPAEILEKVEMMNVEVGPLNMQLDVDDMLREILGGNAGIQRAQAQMEKMRKIIEQMGGEMKGGFDDKKFRELLESFGVDIPELEIEPDKKDSGKKGGKDDGKSRPLREELAHPKSIN